MGDLREKIRLLMKEFTVEMKKQKISKEDAVKEIGLMRLKEMK